MKKTLCYRSIDRDRGRVARGNEMQLECTSNNNTSQSTCWFTFNIWETECLLPARHPAPYPALENSLKVDRFRSTAVEWTCLACKHVLSTALIWIAPLPASSCPPSRPLVDRLCAKNCPPDNFMASVSRFRRIQENGGKQIYGLGARAV